MPCSAAQTRADRLEVVFSLDTTGDDDGFLAAKRDQVSAALRQLKDVLPSVPPRPAAPQAERKHKKKHKKKHKHEHVPAAIRAAVVARGDYSSSSFGNYFRLHNFRDLTDQLTKLAHFVQTVRQTRGLFFEADAYTDLLTVAHRKLGWSQGYRKVLVVICDTPPYPTDGNLESAKASTSLLQEMGVIIYVVVIKKDPDHPCSQKDMDFFRLMTGLSGGHLLHLSQLEDLRDALLAICAHEWGTDVLAAFEGELRSQQRESRLSRDLEEVLTQLKQTERFLPSGPPIPLPSSPTPAPSTSTPFPSSSTPSPSTSTPLPSTTPSRITRATKKNSRSNVRKGASASVGMRTRAQHKLRVTDAFIKKRCVHPAKQTSPFKARKRESASVLESMETRTRATQQKRLATAAFTNKRPVASAKKNSRSKVVKNASVSELKFSGNRTRPQRERLATAAFTKYHSVTSAKQNSLFKAHKRASVSKETTRD